MKILITGGLGFIGHNLVKTLDQQGHQVSIIDNSTDYGVCDSQEIKSLISQRLATIPKSVTIYKADINNYSDFCSIFNNNYYDAVIHLASFPRQKTVSLNPALAAKTMIEGTVNLLRAANNIGKFLFVSSSMVYGDFLDPVDENSPCNPKGQYGILKLAGENLVKDWFRESNIPYTIVRPSAVYGPFDISDRLVPKFLQAAHNNKTLSVNGESESIDFTYIDDLVSGISLAASSPNADNETFNITRGSARPIYDAAKLAVGISGGGEIKVNNRDNRYPSRATLDISKAKNLLGYLPQYNIEHGFEKTYQYMIRTL